MIDRVEARERIGDWVRTPPTALDEPGGRAIRGTITGVAIHAAFVRLEGDARSKRFSLRELDWETGEIL